MSIKLETAGSFSKTETFLAKVTPKYLFSDLDAFGKQGAQALANNTPKDTGKTAKSWEYRIIQKPGEVVIEWYNTNDNAGTNVAILIQYGHGTKSGSYIQGIDYINPAIKPIFDEISNNVWKKVTLA